MELTAMKELMAQFDASSLREFSYKNGADELTFSKNNGSIAPVSPASVMTEVPTPAPSTPVVEVAVEAPEDISPVSTVVAEGDVVESPLVGVAYLAPSPEKPTFVSVGDTVKKGQTLLIIEAMKVMNEIPAPQDGVVTEVLVTNETVVEFGQGLVRIK